MTNGYIQTDILGRKRGLKFGMIAIQQITLDAKRLGAVLGNEIDMALVPVIIYWGLYNNCYIKREDPDFSFEDVCDFVDANLTDTDKFAEIVRCFYNSKIVSGSVDKVEQDSGEKKSSTLTQSEDGTS